tara:strand:- start:8 stop:175 length:168 start_codon:yes stop_codon:yes gene_type:complete
MKERGTLAEGKWNEAETSEYKKAAKMYDPVLRFLKQLQEENDAESLEEDRPEKVG